MVDERDRGHVDALLLEPDLVPGVEDPDEVVLAPLETDPVVDVTHLGGVDVVGVAATARGQLRHERLLERPSEAAVGVARQVAGPADAGLRERQQARRVVLDHRRHRHDRGALGPRRDQLLLRAEGDVRVAADHQLERADVAGLDDLHVEPGVAVPALRPAARYTPPWFVFGVQSRTTVTLSSPSESPSSDAAGGRRPQRGWTARTRAVDRFTGSPAVEGSGDGGCCQGEARRASAPTAANSSADSTATTTTATKMRSTWKLDFDRLMNTPRPRSPATSSPITAPATA